MFNSNFRKLSQTVHKNISKQISFKHVSITCTILMLQKMSLNIYEVEIVLSLKLFMFAL